MFGHGRRWPGSYLHAQSNWLIWDVWNAPRLLIGVKFQTISRVEIGQMDRAGSRQADFGQNSLPGTGAAGVVSGGELG